MKRHLLRACLTTLLLPLSALADKIVAEYGFDDSALPRVEDGFYLFENALGFVEPTREHKFSGYQSLELKEEPVDGAFVELQGVFPDVRSGEVLFHFAINIANPEEDLNIALAGPEHFYMKPHGMLFWLKSIDGMLYYHSDSMPKPLMKLEADHWYVFDAVLHIDRGTFDLRAVDGVSGERKFLVKDVPNAINFKGGALRKLSFIGDLEDRSSVHYYVDDVRLVLLDKELSLEQESAQEPAASSGPKSPRPAKDTGAVTAATLGPSTPRKGYYDILREVDRKDTGREGCVPALSFSDFGISRDELKQQPSLRHVLRQALGVANNRLDGLNDRAKPVALWKSGCDALAQGRNGEAYALLSRAVSLSPDIPLFRAGHLSAALAVDKRPEAEMNLLTLYAQWHDDPRLPITLALLARNARSYDEAAFALSGLAQRLGEERSEKLLAGFVGGDPRAAAELRRTFGKGWRRELDHLYIAQTYFDSLLRSARYSAAQEFAEQMIERYQTARKARAYWTEKLADSLILGGGDGAKRGVEMLESVAANCGSCPTVKRKLRELRN